MSDRPANEILATPPAPAAKGGRPGPPLADRLALRPAEAADALGIGERTLRQILPTLPHVRIGGIVLLPVGALVRWLEDRAKIEQERADAVADEIIAEIRRGK